MDQQRDIEIIEARWNGVALSISYEPNWLSMERPWDRQIAHLQIQTEHREPLPITETGYRSHFLHPSLVENMGGPLAFSMAWLDQQAARPQWIDQQKKRGFVLDTERQLSLF